jgi:hypothetical protein
MTAKSRNALRPRAGHPSLPPDLATPRLDAFP